MRLFHNIVISVRDCNENPETSLAEEIFNWCKDNYIDNFEESFVLDKELAIIKTNNLEIYPEDFEDGFIKQHAIARCYDTGYFNRDYDAEEKFGDIIDNFAYENGDIKYLIRMTIGCYCVNDGSYWTDRMWNYGDSFDDEEAAVRLWDECEDYHLYNYTVNGCAYLIWGWQLTDFPWGCHDNPVYIGSIIDNYLMGLCGSENEGKFAVVLPGDKNRFEGIENTTDKPLKLYLSTYDLSEHPEDTAIIYNLSGDDLADAENFVFMTDDEINNYKG